MVNLITAYYPNYKKWLVARDNLNIFISNPCLEKKSCSFQKFRALHYAMKFSTPHPSFHFPSVSALLCLTGEHT
jgi:hypothetical protein